MPALVNTNLTQCPIVYVLTAPYGFTVAFNNLLVLLPRNCFVYSKYAKIVEAVHKPGFALKYGKWSSG